jgi:hypothetical protein
MMPTRKYFGNAAHFIGADACRFHIATRIGEVVVSTVGEYRPQALTRCGGSPLMPDLMEQLANSLSAWNSSRIR